MVAAAILDFGKCQQVRMDRAICAKFSGQMHHGHAEMHDT